MINPYLEWSPSSLLLFQPRSTVNLVMEEPLMTHLTEAQKLEAARATARRRWLKIFILFYRMQINHIIKACVSAWGGPCRRLTLLMPPPRAPAPSPPPAPAKSPPTPPALAPQAGPSWSTQVRQSHA